MFTEKELLSILESTDKDSIRKKIIKKLNLPKIEYIYTIYIDPLGKVSQKFATSDEAHDYLEKIIGEWNEKTASEWRKYEFVDVEYGKENSYSF
ncbi:MAG: hypothetical protein ACK52I_07650 [Pseudomonadota bacterium]|jgi:hypothetical protein